MNVPNVKDCIAYIESCNYKLTRQHRMFYVFESTVPRAWRNEITFTLGELRDAKLHGF